MTGPVGLAQGGSEAWAGLASPGVGGEKASDDVRAFIDVDELAEMWAALVLPPRVRRAWAGWFRRHRDLDLPC